LWNFPFFLPKTPVRVGSFFFFFASYRKARARAVFFLFSRRCGARSPPLPFFSFLDKRRCSFSGALQFFFFSPLPLVIIAARAALPLSFPRLFVCYVMRGGFVFLPFLSPDIVFTCCVSVDSWRLEVALCPFFSIHFFCMFQLPTPFCLLITRSLEVTLCLSVCPYKIFFLLPRLFSIVSHPVRHPPLPARACTCGIFCVSVSYPAQSLLLQFKETGGFLCSFYPLGALFVLLVLHSSSL